MGQTSGTPGFLEGAALAALLCDAQGVFCNYMKSRGERLSSTEVETLLQFGAFLSGSAKVQLQEVIRINREATPRWVMSQEHLATGTRFLAFCLGQCVFEGESARLFDLMPQIDILAAYTHDIVADDVMDLYSKRTRASQAHRTLSGITGVLLRTSRAFETATV